MFYSRKNFTRPELQHEKHKDFSAEIAHLDSFFDGKLVLYLFSMLHFYMLALFWFLADGHAYCLGSLKQDRWYLYTLNPLAPTPPLEELRRDQTLEILMSDLDRSVMRQFTMIESADGKTATKVVPFFSILIKSGL